MVALSYVIHFAGHGLGPFVPSEERTLKIYPITKHSFADGNDILRDDSAPFHRALGLSEWFDVHENDVTYMQ